MADLEMREQLREIGLQQIMTFLIVADMRSFRAAAEELRISQSALSVRVKQLETALGVVLLHRTTRSVRLTAQGRSAQASLRRVCSDLQRAVRDLRDEAALRRGLATVAVLPSLAATLMPEIIQAFAIEHPGVEIRLRDADSRTALAMVRRGEVDMSTQARTQSLEGLLFTSLFDDEYLVLMPPGDLNPGRRRRFPIRDLRDRTLLLNPRGVDLRESLETLFERAGLAVSPAQELIGSSALVALVSAGLGTTILPRTALSGLDVSRCQILPLHPAAAREIGIVVQPERARSPAVLAFQQFTKRRVAEMRHRAGQRARG